MPKAKKSSQDANVYHFGFRWSTPHTDDSQACLFKHFKKHCNVDRFVFQAEDTEDNPHYQGYFHTKDKKRPKALAILWNDKFTGIEIQAASDNGKEALQNYAMKEDTRVAGPWADKRIYMGADLWSDDAQPLWQRQLLDKVAQPPDDRIMYWIYDKVGNNGKTKFAKTLAFRHDALILGYGDAGNILNLVSKFPGKNCYCWNLTRAKPDKIAYTDLYSAMESVKDGLFINLKYETGQVLMDPPHIVVMSNELPRLDQISADRWRIYTINHLGMLLLEGKDLKRAVAIQIAEMEAEKAKKKAKKKAPMELDTQDE